MTLLGCILIAVVWLAVGLVVAVIAGRVIRHGMED
jgi:hypothetical protein